ncbi:MAG: hypothetical protein RL748_2680, partial [Pseudomonadota bacterium]
MTIKLHAKSFPALMQIGILTAGLALTQTAFCSEPGSTTGPRPLSQNRSHNTINNTSGTQEDKIAELIAQRMNEKPGTLQAPDPAKSIGNPLQNLTHRA